MASVSTIPINQISPPSRISVHKQQGRCVAKRNGSNLKSVTHLDLTDWNNDTPKAESVAESIN